VSDAIPPTGPLDARLGRWLLERLVATAVRYGHPFSLLAVRTAEPEATAERFAAVLRGADIVVLERPGELLVLLPDTGEAGTARAMRRLQEADASAQLSGVTWNGDLAADLIERARGGGGAITPG
jgi:hypothetical protein